MARFVPVAEERLLLWRIVRAYLDEDRRAARRLLTLGCFVAADLATLLVLPLVNGNLVDALTTAQVQEFVRWLLVLSGLIVLRTPLTYLSLSRLASMGESVARHLRTKTIRGYWSESAETIESRGAGDVAARVVGDTAAISQLPSILLLQVPGDLLSLVLLSFILVDLNWMVATVLVISLPLSVVLRSKTAGVVTDRSRRVREALGGLQSSIHSWFHSPLDVVGANMVRTAVANLDATAVTVQEAGVASGRISAAVGALNATIVALPNLAVFGYGGYLVTRGSLTVGDLVAFSGYVAYLNAPVQRLITIWGTTLPAMVPAASRVAEKWQAATVARSRQVIESLCGQDLCYRRPQGGGGWTLTVPSIVATRGILTFIIGANGVGKTSTLRLLGGLSRPASGTVRGVSTGDTGTFLDPPVLAYCPSRPQLFNGTLEQNLAGFRAGMVDRGRLLDLLSSLDLASAIDRLPGGLGTVLGGTSVVGFSAGELKALGVVRAMYDQDMPVLLDDPYEAMDQSRAVLLDQLLLRESARRIVIVAGTTVRPEGCPRRVYVAARSHDDGGDTTTVVEGAA